MNRPTQHEVNALQERSRELYRDIFALKSVNYALLKENQELKEMIENKGAQIDQSIENWNALKHEYDKMEAQYKYCQELNAELLAAVKIAKFHVPSINYKSHWDIIQSAINKTESK